MSITDDYLKRAEEFERLAADCQSDSNRKIFLDIAAKWRSMAADAATSDSPQHRQKRCRKAADHKMPTGDKASAEGQQASGPIGVAVLSCELFNRGAAFSSVGLLS